MLDDKLILSWFLIVYSDITQRRIRLPGCAYDGTASCGGWLQGLRHSNIRGSFFLVLYHQKVALNSGCAGEDGRQNANEPLQKRVCVVESITSIPVCGAIVKSINGYINFRLALVHITQGLVLAPDITNLLDVEGIVDTLPVALQIYTEVTGQNADNLMG